MDSPDPVSSTTRTHRSAGPVTRVDSKAPTTTPGIAPISSVAARPRSASPLTRWPRAAAATTGMACTRSVPTRWFALSRGCASISITMMREPEPTEVMPTTVPPTSPIARVASGRTVTSPASAGAAARRRSSHMRTSMPTTASSSATPMTYFTRRCNASPSPSIRSRKTPPNAAGTAVGSSRRTMSQRTVPARWCTTAPNGFMNTEAARSLPMAAVGFTPKTITMIGVMSAPPPIPVSPTARPTRAPERMIGPEKSMGRTLISFPMGNVWNPPLGQGAAVRASAAD